ncbi:MAG: protoglobin domain-containing protein [Candidatus Melainabacteria bacterium]|nr:protoglobin domain-containing protein [Candidatus Melainabacteria bacterium]
MGKEQSNKAVALTLTPKEVELRKRWLEFSASDEELIELELDLLVADHIDELIESMYAHFLTFDETRSFFPNEQVLKRAQSAQKDYFLRLTKGTYDTEYANDRLRVGATHHRIDLDPKWYIGAYNRVLAWFLPKVIDKYIGDAEKLGKAISALMKVVFLDMGLAIDCYISAKEMALRQHTNAIRELETERRVTKSILENSPVGIISLDKDMVCLECNDKFIEIVDGDNRNDIVSKPLFEIAPGLKPALFKKVLSSGQFSKRNSDALKLSKKIDSETNYFDWLTWPIKDNDGNVTGLVAMFTDTTANVLLQQQREDFVATLTHDLKTPVSATIRAVQFLLDGDFGPVPETQVEVLETILQSNTALYSLVQTLLDVYRFDSGVKEFHMTSCDMVGLITRMISEIMPLAREKGVTIHASVPQAAEEVICDQDEIRRVVQNLIDNSLKFTPGGGSITVALSQLDSQTILSVSDTGKGIPEENRPKLFQRFWQAGSTGRYYASTGLGLYLCRRIIEGHGGKIWCKDTQGPGTTFCFELLTRGQDSAIAAAT